MMKQSARHLVLLSRNGPKGQAAQTLLLGLKLGGVAVLAPPCDIGDEAGWGRDFRLINS